jgi:hypothetical protein
MEFTKIESAAIQEAVSAKADDHVVELTDTLLAIVGGGAGEVFLN